jgi:hypothetical protein
LGNFGDGFNPHKHGYDLGIVYGIALPHHITFLKWWHPTSSKSLDHFNVETHGDDWGSPMTSEIYHIIVGLPPLVYWFTSIKPPFRVDFPVFSYMKPPFQVDTLW